MQRRSCSAFDYTLAVLQNLTYSYLLAWIVGGLMLLTILLLRTQRRPFWLSFASIGFGAAGFVSLALGLGDWKRTLMLAVLGGLAGAALGLGVRRLEQA